MLKSSHFCFFYFLLSKAKKKKKILKPNEGLCLDLVSLVYISGFCPFGLCKSLVEILDSPLLFFNFCNRETPRLTNSPLVSL